LFGDSGFAICDSYWGKQDEEAACPATGRVIGHSSKGERDLNQSAL